MGPQDFVLTDKGHRYFQTLVETVTEAVEKGSKRPTDIQIEDYVVLALIDGRGDFPYRDWNEYARGRVRRLFETGYIDHA